MFIVADPVVPLVTAEYAMGKCALNISWTAPNNTANSDTNHFMIYIDGMNVLRNMTNINNGTLSHPVRGCSSHSVSVRAVNRCGREGRLPNTTVNPGLFCDNSVCVGDNAGTGNCKCTH